MDLNFNFHAASRLNKLLRRSFAGGQFLFGLDDESPVEAGYIKSVSGGTVKGKVMEEQVGPDHFSYKHVGNVEIEPISVELGMSLSKPVLEWIRDSWKLRFGRRNGYIVHADSNFHSRFRQEFKGALIAETKFPELDAANKEPVYITVNIHPESLEITEERSPFRLFGRTPSRQKLWTAANFCLVLDKEYGNINKIESFSVKQNITQLYFGSSRFPEIEPTGIEFGNLVLHMPLEFAGDFLKWHDDYVIRGARDASKEKDGFIEYLSPDTSRVLLRVNLNRVGLQSLAIDKSEAGEEKGKTCKVELYVESMDLEYGAGIAGGSLF